MCGTHVINDVHAVGSAIIIIKIVYRRVVEALLQRALRYDFHNYRIHETLDESADTCNMLWNCIMSILCMLSKQYIV